MAKKTKTESEKIREAIESVREELQLAGITLSDDQLVALVKLVKKCV